ncbi:MAG TPA: ThuA domain-containing protein [Planctomycetota bacterium]|nr:ThuA domain-containing protein [Planctomycetota bacterium]HRR80668.1 ThuA domain-containing protein [Planctomycetota bacterium]HRT93256.1 ThuA domain-containing protein [Planctomycetota bacterium]
MRALGNLWGLVVAAVALGGEAVKEPPPTWPWPGPTPPEQREAMMKRTFLIQPAPQDMKTIEELAPDKPPAAPQKPRKLLLWGRVWTHMANPMTEETVKTLGRKTGAFEVVVTDDPQMLLPEKLKGFDAIFLNGLHDPTPFLPHWLKSMPKEEQEAAIALDQKVKASILKFVGEDGKGIAGIEGSICALRDWKEFGELMGAFYAGHYVGNFVLKVDDPAHPLTACLAGQAFKVFDQGYVPGPPYSPKKVRVLLSLDLTQTPDPVADPKAAWLKPSVEKLEQSTGRREYPISWVKSYGKGRVFYLSLGVQKAPYSNPLFMRYLLGGIQFALGDLPGDTTPSEK